jgi:hypothetical protein
MCPMVSAMHRRKIEWNRLPSSVEWKDVEARALIALAEIKEAPDDVRLDAGAVNWGDLEVTEICWCLDWTGEARWLVRIEEADPGCKIPTLMHEKMGRPANVEVLCEW